MTYINAIEDLYRDAALIPNVGLCCTTTPIWQLPELQIPSKMIDMNYGCGSTIHPRDLAGNPRILYVGVGGGMELLQFAYFSRFEGSVTGIDLVDEMLTSCSENFEEAEKLNPWFSKKFITLQKGDALHLDVEDGSYDVVAQNCLFNVFKSDDLKQALNGMYKALRPGGKLILSDPVCEIAMPESLVADDHLRAMCLSGATSLATYINMLTDIGFGTIEVRAKRPYRILSAKQYGLDEDILIESVEVCAIKDPVPEEGPCVFTGRVAIYHGTESFFDDKHGHVMYSNQPLSVCDKTAKALLALNRKDIYISPSTWHYDGGGCC